MDGLVEVGLVEDGLVEDGLVEDGLVEDGLVEDVLFVSFFTNNSESGIDIVYDLILYIE